MAKRSYRTSEVRGGGQECHPFPSSCSALAPDSLSLGADVEVDVDELNQEQVADLNKQATTYGMADGDFVR